MDLESIAKTYETIAKYGFPFVVFLALIGSYFDIWRWGKAVRERELKEESREAATVKRLSEELAEVKRAAALREAEQQKRIDQLFDKMIEAAGLIEKSARVAAR